MPYKLDPQQVLNVARTMPAAPAGSNFAAPWYFWIVAASVWAGFMVVHQLAATKPKENKLGNSAPVHSPGAFDYPVNVG
jgi:hypothetical protein